MLLLAVPLAGCQTFAGTGAETSGGIPPKRIVSGYQAAAIFGDVCLAQAPGFARSSARMERYGIDRIASSGAVYHRSGTLSAQVQTWESGDGGRFRRCSVSFEDKRDKRTLKTLTGIMEGYGARARYLGRSSLEGRPVYLWQLRTGGAIARVVFLPYESPVKLPSVIIDVPVNSENI